MTYFGLYNHMLLANRAYKYSVTILLIITQLNYAFKHNKLKILNTKYVKIRKLCLSCGHLFIFVYYWIIFFIYKDPTEY